MGKKNKKNYSMYENTEPKCPPFGFCGGCAFQKITYDRQLEIKEREVKALLDSVYGEVFYPKDSDRNPTNNESASAGGEREVSLTEPGESMEQGNEIKCTSGYLFEGITGSHVTEGYRNKMEFTFGNEYKDGPFALGLHEKGSFMNIVNITECRLAHSDINKIRNSARVYFNEYDEKGEILFHNNRTHKGWLRHLLVRRASKTGEILVALVTTSDIHSGVEAGAGGVLKAGAGGVLEAGEVGALNEGLVGGESDLEAGAGGVLQADIGGGTSGGGPVRAGEITPGESLARAGEITPGGGPACAGESIPGEGIVNSCGTKNNESRLQEEAVLAGFCKKLQALELEGKIAGFLHITNDSLADAVKADKTDIIFGRDYIFEQVLGLRFRISAFSFFQTNTYGAEILYSKAGEYAENAHGRLFDLYSGTGTIAQLMAPAVEKVVGVEIVKEAVESARENAKLNGIDNAEFIAADVLKAVDELGKPDSLILDPPRDGINPKALGKILSWGVDSVVYISCNPKSLARDLEYFKIAGYKLEKACAVDMFPGTEKVETVCLLSKVQQ